jgi:phosphoglycolate phosphatase-like HAD superfamily hydrolase
MHICLIDIDGTLLLTGGAGQAAYSQTLADDFGIPRIVTPVAFAGRSDRAIALELLHEHGVEPSVQNWQRFCVGYLSRLDAALAAHEGSVLPGAVTLLETLSKRDDVAIGLVTGNIREGARRKLVHFNLWHWFSFGGFGDDHIDRCDIAAAALAAARAHINGKSPAAQANGITNGQVIVIGDTPQDVVCGRSINARCVVVPTGHTPADELRRSSPDVLIDSLEDIDPILGLLDDA